MDDMDGETWAKESTPVRFASTPARGLSKKWVCGCEESFDGVFLLHVRVIGLSECASGRGRRLVRA